jgi:uncharacterized protein YyaL (SSP411 family)
LAGETSPYLRQHADNPVDWYPWGDEALAEARRRDVPLFVSIGYSACHWCHVMAHESFEDAALAAKLNEGFVPVKVDREERPDVDSIYMDAVQALTGGGGWPLSAFCTPEGRPFFAGTYFPPRPRGGMPGFGDVLDAVAGAWATRRDEVVGQAEQLTAAVAARVAPPPAGPGGVPPAEALFERAIERVREMYDPEHGGIGRAPKFPNAPTFELVALAARDEVAALDGDGVVGGSGHGGGGGGGGIDSGGGGDGQPSAPEMLTTTLEAMASGGIYDHLAGGFCRYSTDGSWQVPHFEKMLYDQAMLAPLYLHAWQLTGDERWLQVVGETLDYVCTTMRDPSGGFWSAEDADAGGVEGAYQTWTPSELAEVLGPERAALAAAWYGISEHGNFEHGRSIPHLERGALLRPAEIEACRAELLAARGRRVRPGIDDKVLTEWNAMTISALAEAAAATGTARWLEAARGAAEMLLGEARRRDGRWLRSWQAGRGAHLAVASDYAWLVDCFTRLGEATGERRWTDEALAVASALIELFSAEDGGWYTTGSDAEALVVRPREVYDGVTPAAGSVAATALARLGALTGSERLLARAAESVSAGGEALARSPAAFPRLVVGALLLDPGPLEVVVTGTRPDLVAVAQRRWSPTAVLAWGEPWGGPLWERRPEGLGFVCRAGTCRAPATSSDDLLERLAEAEAERRSA